MDFKRFERKFFCRRNSEFLFFTQRFSRLSLVLMTLCIEVVTSLSVDCSYNYNDYGDLHIDGHNVVVRGAYGCFGVYSNECDNSLTIVTGVSVNYTNGKSLRDVEAFDMQDSKSPNGE